MAVICACRIWHACLEGIFTQVLHPLPSMAILSPLPPKSGIHLLGQLQTAAAVHITVTRFLNLRDFLLSSLITDTIANTGLNWRNRLSLVFFAKVQAAWVPGLLLCNGWGCEYDKNVCTWYYLLILIARAISIRSQAYFYLARAESSI